MVDIKNGEAWLAPELASDTDPFEFVEGLRGEVFRAMPDRTTLRFHRNGRGYFLKYHRGVGWGEIAKNLLSFRLPILSAENERDAIALLARRGVSTMVAAGYGCKGANPATQRSFLITEEIAQAPSLEEVTASWAEAPPSPTVKRRLIRKVAAMVRDMHAAGVNHRDLYLCHFLLRGGDPANPDLALIDLHRAQIRGRVPARWRRKDLAALYSSVAHIPLKNNDMYLFLREYYNRPLREVLADKRELRDIFRLGEKLRKKYLRKYAGSG